jgi:molybdopterin converting factor subunit 1
MRVTVRLFARLRELAERETFPCEVGAHATVADVWREASIAYPPLAAFRSSVSPAVNADFAPWAARVHEGDEIAFLPPVSGG